MPARMILVDDDPMILRLGEQLLTSAGFEVLTAANGHEALALAIHEAPDLILTDVQMPEMDGIELCRALREHSELIGHVYIIALSASNSSDRLVAAFEAGADDFLGKPFNRNELVARITAGTRLVQFRDELEAKELELHRRNAELEVASRELARTNSTLAEANARLDAMATTDELTGLQNRRAAMAELHRAWDQIERSGGTMSLVMMDIDHFKRVNDTLGHDAGDAVLKQVSEALDNSTRSSDSVYRLGGEEFLLLCASSDERAAAIGAERIRAVVEATTTIHEGQEIPVTLSLGVAERTAGMVSVDQLLKRSDEALYEAKSGGRNCVVLASGETASPPAEILDADLSGALTPDRRAA